MSIPIRAGVVLGVLCVVWTFVMGFTGWYKDPVMLNLFFLVIPLELGIVIWALRKTAAGATWGGQVVNGLVLSLVASVIIFAGSLLFTTVAFPNYFNDIQAVQTEMLKSAGMSEADISRRSRPPRPCRRRSSTPSLASSARSSPASASPRLPARSGARSRRRSAVYSECALRQVK